MSLIQQALEKTGKVGSREISLDTFLKKPTEKLPPKESAEKPKRKSPIANRVRGLQVLLLVLFVLIQTGIIYYFLISPNRSQFKNAPKAAPVPNMSTSVQTVPMPLPAVAPKPKRLPTFVLTGITSAGESKFAIINNKMVTVGDEVSKNVTVIDILPGKNTVILQDEGREISLKL